MTQIEMLKELQDRIFLANAKQGFWEIPDWALEPGSASVAAGYLLLKKAEKIALIHSEASEALEGIRKSLLSDHLEGFSLEEEELADVLIRVFDYAGGFNLRLAEAVFAKLDFNAQRPFKHGKSF